MMQSALPDELQLRLSQFVAQRTGLQFSAARWLELQQGLTEALSEMGFADPTAGARWLVSASLSKTQMDTLARHLTIGETYFFRGKNTFDVLAKEILPQMIRSRRDEGRRMLRVWSAGCCTGEEPYSLSILLQETIPDLADWFVTILATDINTHFLQIAAEGVYRDWSFRETRPGFRERYFTKTQEGHFAILAGVKKYVVFKQSNLVQDAFPGLVSETNAMDLIFCRNVLMYFSPEQARKVVANLRRALVPGGWLVVSPSETSQSLFSQFTTVNYPGVVLYRKPAQLSDTEHTPLRSSRFETKPIARPAEIVPDAASEKHFPATFEAQPLEGEYSAPLCTVDDSADEGWNDSESTVAFCSPDARVGPDAVNCSRLTRILANQGKLTEALSWCDKWVEADRFEPSGHYFRGILLQELGDGDLARRSFQASVYLDPRFVLAHFALGNLARSRGKVAESTRHFRNALSFLKDYREDEVLPEGDGLTAGRLREIIAALTTMEFA